MNPVFPYSGGKRRLLKYILPVIPEHSTYIEPFAGGLAVFLANPSATFGSKESLIGEVSFKMFGDELGENKLSIATIASAFEFEEDAGA
ncbi:DNA adenine methylase [Opitutia bacterium KCR 482]|nr:DNA adenine methylase [Opitutae bacterium KCR 482]MDF3287072.1 DNA adenine methylase [Opitutae bacterium KCR 482]